MNRNLRRYLLSILLTLIFVLSALITSSAQEGGFTEHFDDPAMPDWEHSANAYVVDGVLHIEPDGFANRSGNWTDFNLTLQAKREGTGDMVISYKSGYLLTYKGERLLLQREQNEVIQDLSAPGVMLVPDGEWFRVGINVADDQHNISINNENVLSAFDPEPLPPGGIGFEMIGEIDGEFDDLALNPLGMEGLGSTAPEQPSILAPSDLAWEYTGGPLGGLGYDVRMRPDNPDIMYVTDAHSGVFISTDGGKTWDPSNKGIDTRDGPSGDIIPVFSLTIDPNDHDIIWVGLKDKKGVYKSWDAGENWEKLTNGITEEEGITFRGFTIEPGNSNVVYAAAEISSVKWLKQDNESSTGCDSAGAELGMGKEFDRTKGVIYKTIDGGKEWTAIWRGENLARYVWINPQDTNVVYISTGIFDREAANSCETTTPGGEGVLKSIDGGVTWDPVNIGLNNLYIGSLFMHPTNPDILLAGAGNNSYETNDGVYLTKDGGASWDHVLKNENIASVEFALISPTEVIAYAGGLKGIYRSEDGGHSWEKVTVEENGWGTPGVLSGVPIDFQVDPRNPLRIFANNYGGGNFLSEDGGAYWKDSSQGYTGLQARAVAVAPGLPATIFEAGRSGIFKSTDGGKQWQGLNIDPYARNLEWNAVTVDPGNAQHVLASNNQAGTILESNDGGKSWRVALEKNPGKSAFRCFVFAPSDHKVVYAGSGAFLSGGNFDNPDLNAHGVFRSLDGGGTWQPANDADSQDAQILGLAVDPIDRTTVYAAAEKRGLLKTTDAGQDWAKLSHQNLPGSYWAISVAVDPQNSNSVYLGTFKTGLYHSPDGGASWQQVAAGFEPEASITSIVFSPTHPGHIYAADRFTGVYLSTDGGTIWQTINNKLENRNVNALAFSSDGLHLYAVTEGMGAFRLDLTGQPPTAGFNLITDEGPSPVEEKIEPVHVQETVAAEEPAGSETRCFGNATLPVAFLALVWIWRRKKDAPCS